MRAKIFKFDEDASSNSGDNPDLSTNAPSVLSSLLDGEGEVGVGQCESGSGGELGGAGPAAVGGDGLTVFVSDLTKADSGGEGGEGGAGVAKDGTPLFAASMREVGKGGAGGELLISNAEFIEVLQLGLPQGAVLPVCGKSGDPTQGGWFAQRADKVDHQCPASRNNYANTSAYWPEPDGSVKVRLANFAAFLAVMLDDIGSKIPSELLAGVEPTWEIETSPGNSQMGFVLDTPITDLAEATKFQAAFVAAGLCDPGATGIARWMRMPSAINGKPKYRDETGAPFICKVKRWNPSNRFTADALLAALHVALDKTVLVTASTTSPASPSKAAKTGNEVYTPKATENPVVSALKERGLYKTLIAAGKHEVTCPWVAEHTDALDTGAAYFEPNNQFPVGGYRCQHSHGEKYRISELLGFLDLDGSQARHKARIRLMPGEINRILEAGELELLERGNYYQAGGLIVSIKTDPKTGDASIFPISEQALTQELAACADWEKYDGRCNAWVRTDPPPRHVGMLYKAGQYKHLPVLAGVARQPFFRENDGQLVTQPGYDPLSQRYGVFDPAHYALPEPTPDAARASLAKLRVLLFEFHFAQLHDESAALSGMFTAVLRPSIELAPGFHAKAHSIASGKTLLCEVIGGLAGPGGNRKLSYPKTSEEATKAMLSILLEGPAVVEFDDMDMDWLPHGIINRMLTSAHLTDRILGSSRVATVSTRTLFLGSGNNVGPIRDLARRVITITLNPQCATPATLQYEGDPLATVRKHRAELVSAVLTIVRAWQLAGSPRSNVPNIASYGGAWSDYCRHTLIWLDMPDPATALFEQLKNDPDREMLGRLMSEWVRRFESEPTTVRKVIAKAYELAQDTTFGDDGTRGDHDLLDAICEFPVAERGLINASKFGWMLKRNANRIVDGWRIEDDHADGRKAWRVVEVDAPPSPGSPGTHQADTKTTKNPPVDDGNDLDVFELI